MSPWLVVLYLPIPREDFLSTVVRIKLTITPLEHAETSQFIEFLEHKPRRIFVVSVLRFENLDLIKAELLRAKFGIPIVLNDQRVTYSPAAHILVAFSTDIRGTGAMKDVYYTPQ